MSATDPTREKRQRQSPENPCGERNWDVALACLGCAGIGFVLAWVQSHNPIFGVPVDHPASLVFIACMAAIGLVGALVQRGRSLAKLPCSGLHDEVKRLADAGEKIRAIRLHHDLTGLGWGEAEQAVADYLADRTRAPI